MLYGKHKLQLAKPEREAMRRAGRFNADLMDRIRQFIRPGITTNAIDQFVYENTVRHGHTPATLGYNGYKKSCCTSVNEVICHGIPGEYVLKEGDIVNVDITSVVDGWHGDSSETFLIGEVSPVAKAVAQCSLDCLYASIDAIQPNCRVADIGEAIVALATQRGFSVVREYVGHGVGRQFHQDPTISHFPNRQSKKERLLPGMCFTIEPMINAGSRYTVQDERDGWTVRTKDKSLSAQFEHSILMTEEGPETLTLTKLGPQRGHRL